MSFSVATYQKDKASDVFGPSYEEFDSEFFDQFVTFSPSNFGSQSEEYSCAPAGFKMFDGALSYSNSGDDSGMSSNDDDVKYSDDGFYSELSGRAAISDSELLSLEGISLASPLSPVFTQSSLPSTPHSSVSVNTRRRNHLVGSFSHSLRKATGSLERTLGSPVRKQCSSGISEMRKQANDSQTELDSVGNKLHLDPMKFEFDFEESPKSASFDQILEERFTTAHKLASPFNTPALCEQHSRKISDFNSSPPITSELRSSATFWRQHPPQVPMNSNFKDELTIGQEQQPPIWRNHASKVPLAHPLPLGFHTNPQFATKSLALHLQHDVVHQEDRQHQHQRQRLLMRRDPTMPFNGLAIHMPRHASDRCQQQQQQAFMSENSKIQRGYYDTTPQHRRHRKAQTQYSLKQSPRKARRSRNSITSSPSSTTSSSHVKKRKYSLTLLHKSYLHTPTSSSHTTCSSPVSPPLSRASGGTSGAGGLVDFVNYTPSDSEKILMGVAPSGSSKTKARREKEAMEKRRKLNQAAARAILQAGGSVEGLNLGFEGIFGEEDVYI